MKMLCKRTVLEWEEAIRSLPEPYRPKMLYIALFDYSGYVRFSDSDYLCSLKEEYQEDMTGDYELESSVIESCLVALGYTEKQAHARAHASPTFKRDTAPKSRRIEKNTGGLAYTHRKKVGVKAGEMWSDYGEEP